MSVFTADKFKILIHSNTSINSLFQIGASRNLAVINNLFISAMSQTLGFLKETF